MKDYIRTKFKIEFSPYLLIWVIAVGCSNTGDLYVTDQTPVKFEVNSTILQSGEIAVTPPPFSDGIFPCNDCHSSQKPNPERRKLIEFHDDVSDMFNHDSQNRWCLDCHDVNNRDSLRLASGKLLDFKESYKLCGQCHGDKLRDWKVGVHGRRTGEWNGIKQYYLCVSCHNPHSPKFQPLKPEAPPVTLDEITN